MTLVITATSVAALVLACTAFSLYERRSYRQLMVERLAAVAAVVAANSTAALTFDDRVAAGETLQSLQSEPELLLACLYDAGGEEFARLSFTGLPCPAATGSGTAWLRDRIELFHPILLDGEEVGTFYIAKGLGELSAKARSYLLLAAAVIVLSTFLAYLLAARMQRVVSRPILGLARVARRISRSRDYSLRAAEGGQDEIGRLISIFNQMLDEIENRDRELQRAHDELEERVARRTAELQREVQERKQAQRKLRQFASRLEQSNRDLADFAYVASHDLQEPLRKIGAFGDRLQRSSGDALGDRGKDYLARMQNAAERMSTLIRDLLAFSRVTTAAKPFEPVDLGAVALEVLGDLEVRIQETKAVVELGELPTIEAEPLQMRQVLQNLIGNALKFAPPGEPPQVRVEAEALGDDRIRLIVSDRGIGFDTKYLDRIFGPFQRLHGRTDYEGSGMGLAICRKIVERHGGTITAESTPGEGAAFLVELPRRRPRTETPETPSIERSLA